MNSIKNAIVFSASSDIGTAMCEAWAGNRWNVHGTYRTRSSGTKALEAKGVNLVHCDLSDRASVQQACEGLRDACDRWDTLVVAPGTQDPVGPFASGSMDEWEDSVMVNFTSQLRIVHEMLPTRKTEAKHGPCVIFFAGGGTNNATVNYSAYTISKIALIKMCELLDAEIPDTRFSIVGPGWVKTKIHQATLDSAELAGSNYQLTIDKLGSDECTPMESVLACCDWIVDSPREVVGGRNFSVVHDKWGTDELAGRLSDDLNMYKLRRSGNDWRPTA